MSRYYPLPRVTRIIMKWGFIPSVPLCLTVLPFLGISALATETYISPVDLVLSPDNQVLYVAEETAEKIAVLDCTTKTVVKEIPLPQDHRPSGLTLSGDGTRLYVTIGNPEGIVHIIETETGTIVNSFDAGHTATSPVLHSNGDFLYVCNRFDNTVSILNLDQGTQFTVPVGREPIDAVITTDGLYLFVANMLPMATPFDTKTGAVISVINTTSRSVETSIQLPNGSTVVRGICQSSDGQYAYVTHLLGKYHAPTNQIERGWIYSNVLSIIDIGEKRLVATVMLDDLDLGAANPWSVVCTDDGRYLCITHAGTHELSVIDRTALHVAMAGKTARETAVDFSLLALIRRRLALSGNGPRAVVIGGNLAYVAEYFNGSIGVVNIDPSNHQKAHSIPLGQEPHVSNVRKGERLFYDAQICFQKWLSCSSCHPEARSDALNWDVLNDGFGNAKQVKSLLYSHTTPPTTITACRPNAETSVRAGLRFALFAVRPETDAVAIDEYLKSLLPIESPYLEEGRLNQAALQGKMIFEGSAECASCHPASTYFTDMELHNVGTGFGRHAETEFDTPTLVEVWRTAPYLYRGQARTIVEVLTTFNPEDQHGKTSHLSPEEIYDLAEYVLTIGSVKQ